MDRKTGDQRSGTARELQPSSTTARIARLARQVRGLCPTLVNRKLVGGTRFLYEVDVSR